MHRDGENKTHIRVAWLTKDAAAPFQERPEVNLRKLEEARQIWEKPIEKQSKPVENTYDEGVNNSNIDEHEFAPEVSSTPVKAGRRNQSTSRTLERDVDDNYEEQDLTLNPEEFVEEFLKGDNLEENYKVQENDEDLKWQNELTECDACHFRGRIANHLRSSAACLKELRSKPALRMKGRDEMFILKTALIIGECPSPHCQSGRHEEIPGDCVAWWRSDGWDILGWKGAKADADAKTISSKIKQMLTNRRKRGAAEVPESQGSQCSQRPPGETSGTCICRSCEFQGDVMEHLHQSHQCFEANVKHYISRHQPENNEDFTRRKLMFELSVVMNNCARIECSSRKIKYLGAHLASNVHCLQFYQCEGALLNLPNWSPEASSRIIGRKISQMKRKIKESKEREDSDEGNYFRREIGELLGHVCFKCGIMGPVLEEESFKMTFVGIRDDGLRLWRCSICSDQSPPFDELRQRLRNEGERLRSSGVQLQERELKAVAMQGSGELIFVPSNMVEDYNGPYNGPTCSSGVLVPTRPPAIETIIQECDKALQEKTELDNYAGDLLKRPIITDFQDFLSCTGVNIKPQHKNYIP